MLLVLPSLQTIYVNDQFFPLLKWSVSHKYDKAGQTKLKNNPSYNSELYANNNHQLTIYSNGKKIG